MKVQTMTMGNAKVEKQSLIELVDWEGISFEGFIAKGTFGEFHCGLEMKAGLLYTMKKVYLDREAGQQEILEELKNLRSIDHVNLMGLLAICVPENEQDTLCLLLEHSYGKHLGVHLKQARNNKGKLKLAVAHFTRIAFHVAEAGRYLADRGIQHHDIQASNVYLSSHDLESATPKLGMVGLCRAMTPRNYTSMNGQLVPLRWMSPETIVEEYSSELRTCTGLDLTFHRHQRNRMARHSEDSDIGTSSEEDSDQSGTSIPLVELKAANSMIWSFGVLLFECITFGELPYAEQEDAEVMHSLLAGKAHLEIPKPHSFPTILEKLMQNCMTIRPEKRPGFDNIIRNLRSIGIHKQEPPRRKPSFF